ncbi:hypothetical protein TNCV_94811 [Trichonephila clavipes]|nr:hypothetical protein TNCV_94811 [Trichonephila clavipes]
MNKLTSWSKRLRCYIHLAFPMPLRNVKRLLSDKFRQKRISTLTDLAVGKSWSRLLDGQRRAQISALSRVEDVACFRVTTGHDYLQAHLLKIGLADSSLCLLCKSVPMTGEHPSDCPILLHVLSQDNCGVLPAASAISALYWASRHLMSEMTLVGEIRQLQLFLVSCQTISGEAHFWLNGYVNKQNCSIWSEANPQVYVETPLHPEKLTVWCTLWAGGILLQKR